MNSSACPSEKIKRNVEPSINVFMSLVVFIANFLSRCLLLKSLHLTRCPIFVSPANKQDIKSPKTSISSIHVSRQHSPNQIPKMRLIVNIRQSRCNQYVSLSWHWKLPVRLVVKLLLRKKTVMLQIERTCRFFLSGKEPPNRSFKSEPHY